MKQTKEKQREYKSSVDSILSQSQVQAQSPSLPIPIAEIASTLSPDTLEALKNKLAQWEKEKIEEARRIAEKRAQKMPRYDRRGRPATRYRDPAGYSRTTLYVNTQLYDKLRIIALRSGLSYTDIIEEAFRQAVEKYEAREGEIDTTSQLLDAKRAVGVF